MDLAQDWVCLRVGLLKLSITRAITTGNFDKKNFHRWWPFTPYEMITFSGTLWHIDQFKITTSLPLSVNLLTSTTSTPIILSSSSNEWHLWWLQIIIILISQFFVKGCILAVWMWSFHDASQRLLLCDHNFWFHTIELKLNSTLKNSIILYHKSLVFLTKTLLLITIFIGRQHEETLGEITYWCPKKAQPYQSQCGLAGTKVPPWGMSSILGLLRAGSQVNWGQSVQSQPSKAWKLRFTTYTLGLKS